MPRIHVFNNVTLDGYFVSKAGDMSWAHNMDPEWVAFTQDNARGEAALLFGRVTYEMMAGYWPTPAAAEAMPDVAKAMNAMKKYVVSRSLKTAAWSNTSIISGDLVAETRRLKAAPGPDLLIMGSGTIVAQLAEAGLVDEYQIVVHPLVLGAGRTMFDGVRKRLDLTLRKSRAFSNGNIVLWYTSR